MVVARNYKTGRFTTLKIEFLVLLGNAIWNITGHLVLIKI